MISHLDQIKEDSVISILYQPTPEKIDECLKIVKSMQGIGSQHISLSDIFYACFELEKTPIEKALVVVDFMREIDLPVTTKLDAVIQFSLSRGSLDDLELADFVYNNNPILKQSSCHYHRYVNLANKLAPKATQWALTHNFDLAKRALFLIQNQKIYKTVEKILFFQCLQKPTDKSLNVAIQIAKKRTEFRDNALIQIIDVSQKYNQPAHVDYCVDLLTTDSLQQSMLRKL